MVDASKSDLVAEVFRKLINAAPAQLVDRSSEVGSQLRTAIRKVETFIAGRSRWDGLLSPIRRILPKSSLAGAGPHPKGSHQQDVLIGNGPFL